MPNQPSLSQRAKFYWACVSPYNTWLSAGYTLLGVITTIRDELLPEPWKKYRVIELLPSWPWYMWIGLGIVLVAIALIEGALRKYHLSEEAQLRSKPLIDRHGTPYGSSQKRGESKFIAPGVIVMILVGAYFYWPSQEHKTQQPIKLVTREVITPIIVETGSFYADRVQAIVDASNVVDQDLRKQYSLILVTRVVDDTIDPKQDRILDKSRVFTIPDRQVKIEVLLTNPSQERRIGKYRMMDFYLLCVPNGIGPDDFRTIEEAKQKNAKVCSGRGMSVAPIHGLPPK
jgi:hypothetical protein